MVPRTSGNHAHIFWRQEAENMPKTRPDMIYNFLLRGSRVREKPTSAGNHVNYSSKNMELYAVFRAPKYGQKSGKYAIFSFAGPGEELLALRISGKSTAPSRPIHHGQVVTATTQVHHTYGPEVYVYVVFPFLKQEYGHRKEILEISSEGTWTPNSL